jgi:hypothetical protein
MTTDPKRVVRVEVPAWQAALMSNAAPGIDASTRHVDQAAMSAAGESRAEMARDVKNALCIDGHLNRTFDALMTNTSPDEKFSLLTNLAHTAVDAAFHALTAPSAGHGEGWRPISEAPQGPKVLLWWRTGREPVTGRFIDDERGQGWISDGDRVLPKNQHDCTHFQPLPAAPTPKDNRHE